jgi:hypothetical protein
MSGWIKLHRSLLDWEWYDDNNTKCLFIHCLLRANHSEVSWRGIKIKRGQFITSLESLSKELGLTVSQIRTSIDKLKATNEIASKPQAKSRIITVLSYDSYQDDSKQIANKSQDSRKQIATDKNDKNDKNEDNEKKVIKRFAAPCVKDVFNYMNEKGVNNLFEAEKFHNYYSSNGWMVGKSKMKDWRAAIRNWIKNIQPQQQVKSPRAFSQ